MPHPKDRIGKVLKLSCPKGNKVCHCKRNKRKRKKSIVTEDLPPSISPRTPPFRAQEQNLFTEFEIKVIERIKDIRDLKQVVDSFLEFMKDLEFAFQNADEGINRNFAKSQLRDAGADFRKLTIRLSTKKDDLKDFIRTHEGKNLKGKALQLFHKSESIVKGLEAFVKKSKQVAAELVGGISI